MQLIFRTNAYFIAYKPCYNYNKLYYTDNINSIKYSSEMQINVISDFYMRGLIKTMQRNATFGKERNKIQWDYLKKINSIRLLALRSLTLSARMH